MNRKVSFGAVTLALAVMALSLCPPAQAVKDCATQKCVEIGYTPMGGINTLCWLDYYPSSMTYRGYAYSAVFAAPATYGQDSKGGAPGNPEVMGNRRAITGTSDCGLMLTPVSGTGTTTSAPSNVKFKTKCVAS